MAEITAAGIYVQYWFPAIPRWVTALAAVVGLVSLNLIAVAAYGEAEFCRRARRPSPTRAAS